MIQIKQVILSDVIIEEEIKFTLQEFDERYHIHEDLMLDMIEYSLIEPKEASPGVIYIDLATFNRMQSAARLQRDLDINVAGIAVVLELMDELKEARAKLEILQKHFDR